MEIVQRAHESIDTAHLRTLDRDTPAIRTDAVYAVFTTTEDTFAALRTARALASAMAASLTLIHVRTVPYPLSVDTPNGVSAVETDAFLQRLRAQGYDVRVRVVLCRSEREAIPLAFRRHSLIVIAGRRRWWPTASERWRRQLETAGHFVVFVDRERADA